MAEKPTLGRRWFWLAPALILAGVLLYVFVGQPSRAAETSGSAKKGGAPIPVVAARAVKGDIGVYLSGLGSVTPLNHVMLKTRVDGQLMKVRFTEGQSVNEGDLLAEIDPRPFEAQVAQAEGQLLRDEAQLKNARLDLERYQKLWETNAVAQQSLSAQETIVAQYEGTVKSDRAQLDNAKLNLAYSRITAPIGGRVGLRMVDPGNMVRASDATGLVAITQVQPIAAVFTIPQDQLPPVLKKLRAGQQLVVDAYDRDQKAKLTQGTLLTVDNQIDPTTGTLKCKAVFANDDSALFPNQFVNIRLLVDLKQGVTLVPAAAIQRGGQQSTFVYVVTPSSSTPDRVIAIRPVGTGTREGDLVEIVQGLQPGEVVVLEGVDRLAEGSKVAVSFTGEKSAPAPTAAEPSGAPRKKKS